MKTKLSVPDEIHQIFCNAQGAADCRDKCIKSLFRAKRAIYYAGQQKMLSTKAWRLIFELYPQTKKGAWFYSQIGQYVYPDDSEQGAGNE